MALCAAYLACFYDWSPYLTGGEKASVVVIAADRKQAAVIFRYLREMLGIPLLAGLIERETLDTIELSNDVVIEILAASWRNPRGRTIAAALCDEVAFLQSDDSANPDVEIIGALKPAMATIPMARMLIASSPYARRGVLWNDFEKHYGRNESATLVWKAATTVMNPSVPQSVIDSAYEDDAIAASAEFGGEFRSDVAVLFDRDAIRAVTINGRLELPPASNMKYFGHCDPSGGSADSMTLAIGHLEGVTCVLDAVRERRPPFSPEDVASEFCSLLKTYGISTIKGDRYGGLWPREQFAKRGVTYEPSERSASELYLEFLPLLNAGQVELLDHRRGLSQLMALEQRTSRTGRDLISHPPSGHDDIANVISAVLVNAAIEGQRYHPGELEGVDLSPDENFRQARAAYVRGSLSGRDLHWFRYEEQRRVKRGMATTTVKETRNHDYPRFSR
jgi:hypothetical protein